MMKMSMLVVMAVVSLFAIEIELKDGVIVKGDLLCEGKGSLTLKDGSETVQLFKKSMKRVDTLDVSKSRKFMLGEEYVLVEKNELIYINSSPDSLLMRFRDGETRKVITEKTIASGDSVIVYVGDGSFFETARYWSEGREYYTAGSPFSLETKCDEFEKYEIELKGYAGDNPPQLKGPKIAHEKE